MIHVRIELERSIRGPLAVSFSRFTTSGLRIEHRNKTSRTSMYLDVGSSDSIQLLQRRVDAPAARHTPAAAHSQPKRRQGNDGRRLRDVQDLLGHASLTTTQRYLEPSSDAKRKLVELI